MNDAVCVTGVGVVAPNGIGHKDYWQATLEGTSGIREITEFDASRYPSRLAGRVDGFDAEKYLPKRLLPQTDVSTRLALAAAEWALADAAVVPAENVDYGMGVVTSNATGGFEFTHREFHKLWSRGPQYVSVYESFAWFYAVNTGQISIRHGMRGPGAALVAGQAGGLDAVGHARRVVRSGVPLVISGGVDSAFDPWGWVSHLSVGKVSRESEPDQAYLPFDRHAGGYVPGEGGAFLILEPTRAAQERGVRGYGEVAGYAATFDPPPGSPRPPGLRRAAELALADAGMPASEIDVVFADAAGIREADSVEAEAISGLFGPFAVPVVAPKRLTGRLFAGGGPLDIAGALLAMRHETLPAVPADTDVPEEYGIDLVRGESRRCRSSSALVLARGERGFNSAIVLRAIDD